MRVPIRKSGKYTHLKQDPYLTQEKFDQLKEDLAGSKKAQPILAAEVHRLAEMGDLSENAGYQMAKGKLRGLNQRIIELENHIAKAIIINSSQSGKVDIGNTVTVELAGNQRTFQILGSAESDPSKNIISYASPIGAALMGAKVGDRVEYKLKDKVVVVKILNIN